ncbi:Arm DNA-binding domain-containing protein [Burkholderia ambifaria]|uniref:Arm DNA-binding domain-containing protein n=1 Tax=Burkholderia ambifaria TaxID=152480 RepID=UPI0019D0016F|nr:Arm DNA-binding domain-containing protein [Burkholderia ambifaria]UEP20190.1 Arm DNA-binding domain-containing protein [Burkholderia ambifaria]
MPLTAVEIRQAKAGNKRTKLTDGNGLYLLVKPSGSRLWRYKYRIVGKENLVAIGEYPTHARHARVPANSLRRTVPVSCATRSAVHAHQ